jgi:hypothetical protein
MLYTVICLKRQQRKAVPDEASTSFSIDRTSACLLGTVRQEPGSRNEKSCGSDALETASGFISEREDGEL